MAAPSQSRKRRLLFVVTEDWYFCSHRLPLARAAVDAGYEVSIATRVSVHEEAMRDAGIHVLPWEMRRGSTGVIAEMAAVARLWRIYRKVRPDIVHQVALKPVLYGSLVARLCGTPAVVNALGGMGSIFNAGSFSKRAIKTMILNTFKLLLSKRGKVLILQNPDDRDLMAQEAGVDPRHIRLIRGAGVNLKEFDAVPEPDGLPIVVLPARMLLDKGVGEFVDAARLLKQDGVKARFVLVGGIDECNPSGIRQEQLERWRDDGLVEWAGLRRDMPAVLQGSHIICLPSYREGLPKALLEAASCARAIVATDVPGCREIVRDGENGFLVPARDSVALAAALKKLILSAPLRESMGKRSRSIAEAEFSEQTVIEQTLAIYRDLLGENATVSVPAFFTAGR